VTVTSISIIAPMLNEARHIEDFVDDLSRQDFTGDVELLVADGGSTDGSPELLRRAAERHGIRLVALTNEAGWVSQALNACIRRAGGDLLVRLDCHSRYPPDYLRRCAIAAEETGAEVVGGVIVAEGRTLVERAVACAMDSPFGGIGFYRVLASDGGTIDRLAGTFGVRRSAGGARDGRVETDTLTFGAFRPRAFELAGLFDESLRRNQDDELNLRVRQAGGRVVLDPSIHVHYTPRGSLRSVFRQYRQYGYWKVAVAVKHGTVPGPRSMVPAAFVASVAALVAAGTASRERRYVLAAALAAYAAAATGAGVTAARRRGEPAHLVPIVVAVFPAFHVGYGAGMLGGALRAAILAGLRRPIRF
jgi:glycosyltransferase involved in cell wall biosynthesis